MNFAFKKEIYKKIIYFPILLLLIYFFSLSNIFAEEIPDDISLEQNKLPDIKSEVKISFLNKEVNLNNNIYLSTGRFYIPFEEFVKSIGGQFIENKLSYYAVINEKKYFFDKTNKDTFPKNYINIDNIVYISLYDFLEKLEMIPVFDSKSDKINIYYKCKENPTKIEAKPESISAYLRLEDIMADGIDKEPKFDDSQLEKLRIIADYLNNRNQIYYIAWIPLYKNPNTGIENDLTKNFNTYNASFLYTLDYIADRGGYIGLHGLTHQYKNEISSIGNEFGKTSPFTKKETAQRMLKAKEISRDLGFRVSFFEFPHYEATESDLKCAEQYFDIIYQQYLKINYKKFGHIEKIKKADGRIVLYVPTPADYVWDRYDLEGIKSRMDDSKSKNMIMSLFFHPVIDEVYISVQTTEDGKRIWNYDEKGILPSILYKIFTDGYSFKKIEA